MEQHTAKANTAAEQVKRILIAHQQTQKKKLNDLRAANIEAASTIASKDEQLASKDEQLASKDEQLASKDEEIKRLTLLLEQSREAAERDKETAVEAAAAKEAEIARLNLQLQAKNEHSSTTQQLEATLNVDIARLSVDHSSSATSDSSTSSSSSSSPVQLIEETNAKTAIYNLQGVERRAVVLLQIKHHFTKAWMEMKKAEKLNNKANPFSIRNLSFTHRGCIFLDVVYNSGDVNLRQDFERYDKIESYFDPGFFDIVDGYQLILESNEQRRKHYFDLLKPYAATIIRIRIKSRCNETNRLRDMSHLLKKAVIAKGKGSRKAAKKYMKEYRSKIGQRTIPSHFASAPHVAAPVSAESSSNTERGTSTTASRSRKTSSANPTNGVRPKPTAAAKSNKKSSTTSASKSKSKNSSATTSKSNMKASAPTNESKSNKKKSTSKGGGPVAPTSKSRKSTQQSIMDFAMAPASKGGGPAATTSKSTKSTQQSMKDFTMAPPAPVVTDKKRKSRTNDLDTDEDSEEVELVDTDDDVSPVQLKKSKRNESEGKGKENNDSKVRGKGKCSIDHMALNAKRDEQEEFMIESDDDEELGTSAITSSRSRSRSGKKPKYVFDDDEDDDDDETTADNKWSCTKCRFKNGMSRMTCAMCGN